MSFNNGTLQILIDASSNNDGCGSYSFNAQLPGNYRLRLKHFQVHIYPDITTANTLPLEIYSPNFSFPKGPVRYPTFLYPIDANNKFQGNFDAELIADFASDFKLLIRDATTKHIITDLKYAVITFDYEKI